MTNDLNTARGFRLDKTSGKAVFGLDVRRPGQMYASLMPAPVQGERAASVDDAAAKAVPGVESKDVKTGLDLCWGNK